MYIHKYTCSSVTEVTTDRPLQWERNPAEYFLGYSKSDQLKTTKRRTYRFGDKKKNDLVKRFTNNIASNHYFIYIVLKRVKKKWNKNLSLKKYSTSVYFMEGLYLQPGYSSMRLNFFPRQHCVCVCVYTSTHRPYTERREFRSSGFSTPIILLVLLLRYSRPLETCRYASLPPVFLVRRL